MTYARGLGLVGKSADAVGHHRRRRQPIPINYIYLVDSYHVTPQIQFYICNICVCLRFTRIPRKRELMHSLVARRQKLKRCPAPLRIFLNADIYMRIVYTVEWLYSDYLAYFWTIWCGFLGVSKVFVCCLDTSVSADGKLHIALFFFS